MLHETIPQQKRCDAQNTVITHFVLIYLTWKYDRMAERPLRVFERTMAAGPLVALQASTQYSMVTTLSKARTGSTPPEARNRIGEKSCALILSVALCQRSPCSTLPAPVNQTLCHTLPAGMSWPVEL